MPDLYSHIGIFQWNANGLRQKSGDLRQFLKKNTIPILALTEARVDDDFRLSNYVQYKSSRQNGQSRAMLAVQKDLVSVHLFSSTKEIPEFVACKVRCGKSSVTVVSVYIEPQTTITSFGFSEIFRHVSAPFIICGDFNGHHTMWGSDHCDRRGNVIAEYVDKNNICVLNDGSPTFVRGPTYCSCLDLTLCSPDISPQMTWMTDRETRGSDHFPILVQHPLLNIRWQQHRARITN